MAEYIKREDVIALAWETIYEDMWHMHQRDKVVSVSDIAKLPSADVVERKHGKWESVDDVFWLCSKCHYPHSRSKFCPNCGADMREVEGEE